MLDNACCFIGHRKINETEALKTSLYEIVERLITHNRIDTFLFGSKSRFNDLCYGVVSDSASASERRSVMRHATFLRGCHTFPFFALRTVL